MNNLSDGGSGSDTDINISQNLSDITKGDTGDEDNVNLDDNLAVDMNNFKMIHIPVIRCLMF